MHDHGAVLHSEVPAATLVTAFETITSDLGYERLEGGGDIEVRIWTAAEHACVGVGLPKSLALGLARKLAVRLGKPVRVFTASLVEPAGGGFDCLVDDLTLQKDGTSSVGRWGTDMTHEFGANWDDVCDGKSYFAVSALVQYAVDSVLPGATRETHGLRAPASLGNARLDAIASQIRFAERAELTVMAGRPCARITNAGATATSFLDPAEVEALRAVVR